MPQRKLDFARNRGDGNEVLDTTGVCDGQGGPFHQRP